METNFNIPLAQKSSRCFCPYLLLLVDSHNLNSCTTLFIVFCPYEMNKTYSSSSRTSAFLRGYPKVWFNAEVSVSETANSLLLPSARPLRLFTISSVARSGRTRTPNSLVPPSEPIAEKSYHRFRRHQSHISPLYLTTLASLLIFNVGKKQKIIITSVGLK